MLIPLIPIDKDSSPPSIHLLQKTISTFEMPGFVHPSGTRTHDKPSSRFIVREPASRSSRPHPSLPHLHSTQLHHCNHIVTIIIETANAFNQHPLKSKKSPLRAKYENVGMLILPSCFRDVLALSHTFRTPSPYLATTLSSVIRVKPSTRTCAIRMRPNGSLCRYRINFFVFSSRQNAGMSAPVIVLT
jgi:hypothetical protein